MRKKVLGGFSRANRRDSSRVLRFVLSSSRRRTWSHAYVGEDQCVSTASQRWGEGSDKRKRLRTQPPRGCALVKQWPRCRVLPLLQGGGREREREREKERESELPASVSPRERSRQ